MFGGASPGNTREKVLGHVGDDHSIHDDLIAVLELPKAGRQGGYLSIAAEEGEQDGAHEG